MLFLLYGDDSFRARLKLREIIDQYKRVRQSGKMVRRGGLDLFFFDFQEGDNPDDFVYKLRTSSMFSEKRLFVLKNSLSEERTVKPILNLLKNYKSEEVLIFFETVSFGAGNALFNFLKKNATIQEFKLLSVPLTIKWVEKEVGQLGGKINKEAARALAVNLGGDLWAISNEIKKLICLKGDGIIDIEDIESPNQSVNNVFQVIEAIASGNKRFALKSIGRYIDQGESLFYLLAMVAYQFRTLIIIANLLERGVRQEDIPRLAGLNSFVVSKCLPLLKQTSLGNLKKIYAKIVDTDLKIKTGQLLPRQGLEILILSV